MDSQTPVAGAKMLVRCDQNLLRLEGFPAERARRNRRPLERNCAKGCRPARDEARSSKPSWAPGKAAQTPRREFASS